MAVFGCPPRLACPETNIRHALEKHLNRILIDGLGAKGVLTTIDRYDLGVKLVAYCGEHKLWPRLAFVGQPPVVDGFGALVARNRGLVAETFPNRKEALEWPRSFTAALSFPVLARVKRSGRRSITKLRMKVRHLPPIASAAQHALSLSHFWGPRCEPVS